MFLVKTISNLPTDSKLAFTSLWIEIYNTSHSFVCVYEHILFDNRRTFASFSLVNSSFISTDLHLQQNDNKYPFQVLI